MNSLAFPREYPVRSEAKAWRRWRIGQTRCPKRAPRQPAFPPRPYFGLSIPFAKRTRFFAIRSIVEPKGWSLTR